jgi:prepilin-type N-terminal cleavage/methylation domain-containing protein
MIRNRRGARAAFTLIELLVVIAIIAVLISRASCRISNNRTSTT